MILVHVLLGMLDQFYHMKEKIEKALACLQQKSKLFIHD